MSLLAAARILGVLVPTPDASDALSFRRDARAVALGRLLQLRIFVAPILGTLALTFAFFEPSAWRRVLLTTVVVCILALSFGEWARARRGATVNLRFNYVAMLCAQLGVIAATGGLLSPVIPVLVLMSFFGAMLAELRFVASVHLLLTLPAIWTMAWVHTHHGLVPELFGDAGALESGIAPWLTATLYSAMLVAGARVGHGVREGFEGLFAQAVRDRDRRLAAHAEQTRALSALSAEIAHELKNPLASVKGLGALVARDVEGKPAERMAVLRREVDRMQDIIEELLNFSRPLVPLAMEEVDAGELAHEILRLHEGSAVAAGVTLRVDAEAATLTCDPRKVRQVLINLVQNALEASERGGEVTIAVRAGERVTFRVEDRGEGLSEEIADRLFEPGVTTKETGSGIGLVTARALARQHGGELELAPREGGGCRATLELPREPEAGQ